MHNDINSNDGVNMNPKQQSLTIISLLMYLLIPQVSFASPTSSDFKRCHLLEAKILEYCLKKEQSENDDNNINDICHKKSRKAYCSCHKRVVDNFKPMSKEEQEALNKWKEARRASRKTAEQNKAK